MPVQPSVVTDECLTLYSEVLGLDLRLESGALAFYNPSTGEKRLTYQEATLAAQEEAQARRQAEQAKQEAEQAQQEAEQARRQAIPRLLALGLNVEQIAEALGLPVEDVRQATQE